MVKLFLGDNMEKMNEFFERRVNGYDEHMLNEVIGCKEAYSEMAGLIPQNTKTLLDLGCGTGLELEKIFERFPDMSVTGIDLTMKMLERLAAKFYDKDIVLICGDYFKTNFEENKFDAAVSFQTMHHFSKENKLELYKRIFSSLENSGVYIECDYMAETQDEEDRLFAENKKIREEMNIPENEFYHFDTPCTIENQIILFENAGFENVRKVFRMGNTTIIIGQKGK